MGEPFDPSQFAAVWAAAARAGDDATRLALLRGADLALPLPPDDPPTWPVTQHDGRTWVTAWTAPDLLPDPAAPWWRSSFVDLVHGWPDLRWGLAVGAGTEHPLLVEPGALVRLVVPDLVDELAADPGHAVWVQQLVPLDRLGPLLSGGRGRVSGVVHRCDDLAHIGAPTVLLRALGRADEERDLIPDDGSLHVLRWPVFAAELYRVARGGRDAEQRDAVGGWLVEPPPFRGTGLAAGAVPVREHRVDDVALPHGAAVVEVDVRGREQERARWDAVREVWQLVTTGAAS
ncbi:hypothetical protein SAMN03159343_0901 [Klenkia marina]|uniref:SseB protein N-terminal domain-containing protein n=1 Tax=Klenkia marina TaxID=1960309 RepID=A0A1G4XG41_9ACTN|nr:hypothetical protein [Klenkia marina]SCX40179.1 hypothetical protein SAMN03159343_0901 [Klenkia marina]